MVLCVLDARLRGHDTRVWREHANFSRSPTPNFSFRRASARQHQRGQRKERRARTGDGGSRRAERPRPVARADVCHAGENRKGRRPRHAGADQDKTRADRDRCRQRLRLSGDRAGRNRAAGHGAQPGHRRRLDPPLAPLRRGRSSGRAAGRSRSRRHHVRQHAVGDRTLGRLEGRVRHQPDRIRLPAARPRAAGDRPVALQGRARQHHDGEAARRENPGRLGARRSGPADHRSRTPRSPAPWCRWATRRAPRWR